MSNQERKRGELKDRETRGIEGMGGGEAEEEDEVSWTRKRTWWGRRGGESNRKGGVNSGREKEIEVKTAVIFL